MNKVSVVIPIYNVENYLRKCLDSVCNQTYENLEIICVNDCSPENSSEILKEYAAKDNRIKIINHKKNGGLSAARNTGMDNATGEYIYFLDSDDWIDSDYIEKMVNKIIETDADIVIDKNVITEKENFSAPYKHPSHKEEYTNNFITKDEIVNIMVNAWSKMLKTDFIRRKNLRFPEGYINEDLYFHYIALAQTDKAYFFDGANYHYLSRDAGISKTEENKDIETMKIFSLLYDYFKEHNLLNEGIKIFAVMPFYSINSEEKYSFFKEYFNKVKDYILENDKLYNGIETFFMESILNTSDYEDYIKHFPKSVVISYIKNKKKK